MVVSAWGSHPSRPTLDRSLTHTSNPPHIPTKPQVVVVSNPIDARHWSEELAQALAAEADGGSSSTSYGDGEAGALGVVGLDLEWKPTFAAGAPERRASVLQLSGPGLCLVIQLMRLNGQLPRALKQILKDPTLLKVCG